MASKTEPKRMDDVYKFSVKDWFCIEALTFRHAVGATTSFEPGLVTEVSGGKEIPVATAANAAGILLQSVRDLATATDLANVLFLKRGPAMVNYDNLNFNGVVAATAWAALNVLGIRGYTEPTKTTSLTA
jgi:hypothetical protein